MTPSLIRILRTISDKEDMPVAEVIAFVRTELRANGGDITEVCGLLDVDPDEYAQHIAYLNSFMSVDDAMKAFNANGD